MWQNVFATTHERICYLLSSNEFSDVKFVIGPAVEQKIFPAHKLILAMSSEVFSTMFYGSLPEQGTEVFIPDVDPEAFQLFICYIYTDDIDLQSVDYAIKVYWLADKYMVNRLKILCCSYLANHLSPDTVCEVHELAKLGNCHSLIFRTWKFIVMNMESVIKSSSFLNITCDMLMWIVSRRWLNVSSEVSLIKAIIQWTSAECKRREISLDNQRMILEPFIPEIRFLSLTSAEFVKHVIPTGILTQQESLCILEYLVEPSILLPEYFNKCKRLRNQPVLQNGPESACILTCEETITQVCFNEARVLSKFSINGHSIYIVGIELYLSKKKYEEVIKGRLFHTLFEIDITALLTVINHSSGQIMAQRLTKIDSDQYGNSRIEFQEPVFLLSGETCEIMLDIERTDEPLYWCNGRHTSSKEFEDNIIFSFQDIAHPESTVIYSHIHKILFWSIN